VAVPVFLLLCLGIVVYEFGFRPIRSNNASINFWLETLLVVISIFMGLRLVLEIFIIKKKWARIFTVFGWLFVLFLTYYIMPLKATYTSVLTNRHLAYKLIIYAGVVLAFITEISYFLRFIYSRTVNPGIIFIGSFGILILLGAFLLKLPNAAISHTSTIDALFTAASAVCVTGLTVVDTATHFTAFGQFIILILIQAGGLGFMTFAGLLAYAVTGNTSFKAQLAFTNIMSSRRINNIMQFIYRVVIVTFFFEAIGAVCIYFSLDDSLFERKLDKIFFSVFHAVSAFCNAGFSTYTNGLNEPIVKFNYLLQFLIALLIILGGMGFPIVFNIYKFLKLKALNFFRYLAGSARRQHLPNVIMLNSRLALAVSAILLVLGFISYLLFEQSRTLAQHPTIFGKIATAFFGSVTPRTAGFNTVDLTAMSLPMIMIYLLLMWVGASPASTGGGIKTTTAGVAVLNMISILRGKDRTEFFNSEISFQSIRRAFAIIVISLLLIGIIVFCIAVNDSDKGLIKIAFEAFSAFSTVGLSLGITPQLSVFSKLVLIIAMFVGRVGAITLLIIIIRQSKQLYYRFPKEDIAF
jgi:potassium uptake TrkH family protein